MLNCPWSLILCLGSWLLVQFSVVCCLLSEVGSMKYEVLLWNEAKLSQYSNISYLLSVISCQRYEVWSMRYEITRFAFSFWLSTFSFWEVWGMRYEVWGLRSEVLLWNEAKLSQYPYICYLLSVISCLRYEVWTWQKVVNLKLVLNCPWSLILSLGSWLLALDSHYSILNTQYPLLNTKT